MNLFRSLVADLERKLKHDAFPKSVRGIPVHSLARKYIGVFQISLSFFKASKNGALKIHSQDLQTINIPFPAFKVQNQELIAPWDLKANLKSG